MMNLCKIFGVFEDFEKVTERINPKAGIPVIDFSHSSKNWKSRLLDQQSGPLLRYVLVKLVEERLEDYEIFGGKDPFSGIFSKERILPPMENPPKSAVRGKDYEKAVYIIRLSSDVSHLGIAGKIMEELKEKVKGCSPCLEQTGHGEPAIVAKTDKYYDFATVVGAGFVKVNNEAKELILYGRSRAFTVRYDSQIEYLLGMTGHEFVAKIFRHELPDWNIVVINNDVETSLNSEREVMPEPKQSRTKRS